MSRPHRATELTPPPIGAVMLTPSDPESVASSRLVSEALHGPTTYHGDRRVSSFHREDRGRCSGCWSSGAHAHLRQLRARRGWCGQDSAGLSADDRRVRRCPLYGPPRACVSTASTVKTSRSLTNQSARRVSALHNARHDHQIHVFVTKQRGQKCSRFIR